MEKLSINNFAGFKSVELEIPPVLGLIGPQASGKSIIAKLLYFFRELAWRLPSAVIGGQEAPQYKEECRKRFSRYFPIENIGVTDFAISYLSRGEYVRVTFAAQKGARRPSVDLEWSSFYDVALERFARRKNEILGSIGNDEKDALTPAISALRSELEREIEGALGDWANYEQIFIPAGRAFFSQFQSSIFTRLEAGEILDPFMVAFGSLLERSKLILESSGFYNMASGEMEIPVALARSFEEILHARMGRIEKQDFLEFTDGRRVMLAQASSGQQEASPLLFLLAWFYVNDHWRGRVVYLEEPEAHLFPSSQKLITELMAQAFCARKGKMRLVMTTHSPYILTSVNNLLEAGKLYAGASKETAARLAKIVPRDRTFSPGEVGFYALDDGNAKSIVDSESGLIEADMIDRVSDDIAIEFDKLLSEGMKSPDGRRECSTFLRHKKIALSGKKTTTVYLLNAEDRLVEQIEVDDCVITEGKRCDWLVRLNDAISKEEIYVELRGSHVYDAVEQLRATILKLSADRAKLPKRSFIVFNRNPMIGTDVQRYKAQFRQTFNSGLEFVKDMAERPL